MRYKPCAKWSVKHRSSSLCINIKCLLWRWRLPWVNTLLLPTAVFSPDSGGAWELYTSILVFVVLVHLQTFSTDYLKGIIVWYEVLFEDAFKLSIRASKLAKSIASQNGNFLPMLRLCLEILPLWACMEKERTAAQTHGTGNLYAAGLLLTRAQPMMLMGKKIQCACVIPTKLPGHSLVCQEASTRSN